ncbi:hypothetical protein [uncultured Microbacterium sp.]|uniref:hypothetical protein n=1 Tax=uncultured Microbacterium sp. TaxID=191216 RepID=UPI0025D63175|nr:hypothetical protein [uncultured Microbacterium sp.]
MSGPDDRADDADEVTLWAGRLRAWPTPQPSGDEPDDDTVLSVPESAVDDTLMSRPADLVTDEATDAETTAPRGAAPSAPDAERLGAPGTDEATRPRRPIASGDDADTEAGSRRSRRQAAQPEPAAPTSPTDAARQPRIPAALARETYAPRRDRAVRVARSPMAPVRFERDASAVRPRRGRGAARVATLIAVVAVVVAAAAFGLVVLLG